MFSTTMFYHSVLAQLCLYFTLLSLLSLPYNIKHREATAVVIWYHINEMELKNWMVFSVII